MWYVDIMKIYFQVKKKTQKTTICNIVNLKNTMLPEKSQTQKSMISFTETLNRQKLIYGDRNTNSGCWQGYGTE